MTTNDQLHAATDEQTHFIVFSTQHIHFNNKFNSWATPPHSAQYNQLPLAIINKPSSM